jgi:hypothetical protein
MPSTTVGRGLQALVLFDGDHTLVADLLHRVSDLAADFGFAVGRDGADLRDFVAVLDRAGGGLDRLDDLGGRQVDAALQVHRVHAGGNRLHAFLDDGLRQHGGGGGAVAGFVIGAGSDFLHHLRAHVLELVGQFDFLGDGHAVLGDARGAEGLVDHHVAAFRAQGHLDGIGQDVDAAQHAVAGIGVEFDVFSSHRADSSNGLIMRRVGNHPPPSGDDAEDVAFLHDQQLFAVQRDFGARPFAEQDAVAGLDRRRDQLARILAGAFADGDDLALGGLFLGGVGDDQPALGLFLGLDATDQHAVMQRFESHLG